MNRRTFLKRAGAGVAGLAVAPAALAAGAKVARQDPQPVVFAREDFDLIEGATGGSRTLTLRVGNTRGERTGFDRIWVDLLDNHTEKTTKGTVVALLDVPDKGVQRVICQTPNGDNLLDTGAKKVFDFVKQWTNSTWNKSDISIVRTLTK